MPRPAYAWVLNLDAEHELESGGAYTPPRHLHEIVILQRQRLIGELVAPGDVLVTPESIRAAGRGAAQLAAGLPGFAWSPTPGAIALLKSAGAHPVPAPGAATLRTVNARPFASSLRAPWAPGSFDKHVAHDVEQVLQRLADPAPMGWLVRRCFGAAGRGRRRIASGRPSEAERQWIGASLRRGPLTLEPWVQVRREYTRSGWIDPRGEITVSAPCFQLTTSAGAWTRTDLASRGEMNEDDDERLTEMAHVAGKALADEGYFGPFGIDAFRHREPGGSHDVLNTLSEINARFTMDWASALPAEVVARVLADAAEPLRTS